MFLHHHLTQRKTYEPNYQITNMTPTMSSREIAALTGKEHFNVMRDIRGMLVELKEDVLNFEAIYLDSMNRQQTEYALDRELTETLLTGYSAVLRRKVIARWRELEQAMVSAMPTPLSADPAVRALHVVDAIATALKASNTSRLGMVRQALTLTAPHLLSLAPAYTAEAPEGVVAISSHVHCSLTHLLPLHGVTAKASAFNLILLHHGFLEAKTRASRATPGGVKSFWALTDKGLAYGVNQVHPSSPSETQPRWFEKTFPDLIAMLRQAGATT
jgi:Rha family phage regulatory protein